MTSLAKTFLEAPVRRCDRIHVYFSSPCSEKTCQSPLKLLTEDRTSWGFGVRPAIKCWLHQQWGMWLWARYWHFSTSTSSSVKWQLPQTQPIKVLECIHIAYIQMKSKGNIKAAIRDYNQRLMPRKEFPDWEVGHRLTWYTKMESRAERKHWICSWKCHWRLSKL